MSLTLYISSNCKSPIIYDFEFFLRVRSQSQIWWYFRRVRCQRLPAGEKRGPKMIFYDLFFFDFSILKKVSFTIDIRVIKI